MSKLAALFILVVAVFSGLIASAAVLRYIRQQEATVINAPNTVSLAVAAEKIPAGSSIMPDQLRFAQIVGEQPPEGAFTDFESLVGQYVRTTVYPGEVILKERLADARSAGGLSTMIPAGMRAITLRVDDAIGVAGFVRPGHRVDVLSTVDINEGESVTKTILQNLEVIAVGQEIDDEEKKPKLVPTVTVLASLEQSERLTMAANAGVVRLVLRNTLDIEEQLTEGVSLNSLIPQSNKEVALPEPVLVEEEPVVEPPPRVVEMIRGGERSEVAF